MKEVKNDEWQMNHAPNKGLQMNQGKHGLYLPLSLCVLCQTLYTAFSATQIQCTVREQLFGGLYAAAILSFVLWGLCQLAQVGFCVAQKGSACNEVASVVSAGLLLLGVLQGITQQQQFYYRQFGAGYWWVLFFALLACAMQGTAQALHRTARLLWVFCVVAAVLCVVGFAAQSSWRNLATTPLSAKGVSAAFWAGLALYPEYLVLLLYTPKATKFGGKGKANRITNVNHCNKKDGVAFQQWQVSIACVLLPFFAVLLQVVAVLCSELIFGVQQSGVGGMEFLRSWAFLQFSRFDACIVLLWLLLSLFRLRFLSFVAWQLNPWHSTQANNKTEETQ